MTEKTLWDCGGAIELHEERNGDINIQIKDSRSCSNIRFYDYATGRTLDSYKIPSNGWDFNGSFTLNKDEHRPSLSRNCRLGIDVYGGLWTQDSFNIVLNWCRANNHRPNNRKKVANGSYSYQLSNKSNCKLMVNGRYSNQNVSDSFCQGARSKRDVVTYEYSRKNNCKLMVNGQYSNQNVSDRFCDARH